VACVLPAARYGGGSKDRLRPNGEPQEEADWRADGRAVALGSWSSRLVAFCQQLGGGSSPRSVAGRGMVAFRL